MGFQLGSDQRHNEVSVFSIVVGLISFLVLPVVLIFYALA
jgi:hypothetical protein